MGRLTKGMYGTEFRPASPLFGLRCGQMRGGPQGITHNSGWYNRAGEKLGWGDLDANDFHRISLELQADEYFVILGEQDSFWNFVTRPGIIGSMAAVKPDVETPGLDYVAEKAMYVIAQRQIYVVDTFGSWKEPTMMMQGLIVHVLKKKAVRRLLA